MNELSELGTSQKRGIIAIWFFALFMVAAGCKKGEPEQSEKVIPEVAVQVGKLKRATLHGYVTVYGVVEPEPAHEGKEAASTRLAPATPGIVAEVSCWEGQRVEKGAPLFRLDSRTVDVAIEFATQTLERQKKLIAAGGASQKALQDAELQLATSRAQRALLSIQAPFAGVITRVNARVAEAVDLTSVMGELVDLDRLVVTASVPASESSGLKAGNAAELITGGQALEQRGALQFVSPQVDPKIGATLARISLPPGTALRPGQFLQVRIVSEEHPNRLAAPMESVVKNEEGDSVIAVVEGDKAVQKPVKTGLHDGDLIEVEGEGLKEGDSVVTVGAYGLPKETKVRVLTEKGGTEKH